MEDLKPGQLVRSKSGRDKGKHYLVLEVVDSTRVLLVDGRRRPLTRPKRKNIVHLQPYNRQADIFGGPALGKLTDAHIKRFLEELVSREASVKEEEG